MKKNAQELVTEALKRAVRREASLNTLEVADLLWAIDRTYILRKDEVKSTDSRSARHLQQRAFLVTLARKNSW